MPIFSWAACAGSSISFLSVVKSYSSIAALWSAWHRLAQCADQGARRICWVIEAIVTINWLAASRPVSSLSHMIANQRCKHAFFLQAIMVNSCRNNWRSKSVGSLISASRIAGATRPPVQILFKLWQFHIRQAPRFGAI